MQLCQRKTTVGVCKALILWPGIDIQQLLPVLKQVMDIALVHKDVLDNYVLKQIGQEVQSLLICNSHCHTDLLWTVFQV